MVTLVWEIKPAHTENLVVVLVVFQVILWSVAYSVSVSLGKMKYPNLYLSSAIDKDPSRAVASILGPCVSVLFGLVLFIRSMLLSPLLVSRVQLRLWWMFNVSATILTLSILTISSLPYSYVRVLHMTSAFGVFFSGFSIVVSALWLDYSLCLQTSLAVKCIRNALAICACIGTFGFATLYFFLPLASAILEITATVSMNLYIYTFIHRRDFFGNLATIQSITKQSCSLASTECTDKPLEFA